MVAQGTHPRGWLQGGRCRGTTCCWCRQNIDLSTSHCGGVELKTRLNFFANNSRAFAISCSGSFPTCRQKLGLLYASMPRLKVMVAVDRSKNRAAIRNAPILSPAAHAARIWSLLQFMSSARDEQWDCALAKPGDKFEG